MFYISKIFILSSLTFSLIYADTDSNNTSEYSYIDEAHSVISDTIHSLSKSLDHRLSNDFSDSNLSKIDKLSVKSDSLDSFFQTRKFINETEETFVRITFNSFFQSYGEKDFKVKARAHIPLSRTKKHYNLFIEDITKENIENTLSANENTSTPSIGLNFFAPQTYGLKSKYSVGTSGINPFVRARFNLNFKTDSWLIEPVQQFKYSSDNKFEETSNIYFDNSLSRFELLRYVLYRSTQEEKKGMDYGASIEYFHILNKDTAINLKQSFFANTKYKDISNETFSGIHNYYTAFNWRQNIWKKWFFYELTPGVNFHEQHDFKPNYSIHFSIDMYFGKLYKNKKN